MEAKCSRCNKIKCSLILGSEINGYANNRGNDDVPYFCYSCCDFMKKYAVHADSMIKFLVINNKLDPVDGLALSVYFTTLVRDLPYDTEENE